MSKARNQEPYRAYHGLPPLYSIPAAMYSVFVDPNSFFSDSDSDPQIIFFGFGFGYGFGFLD
jgi:hypothetical protein